MDIYRSQTFQTFKPKLLPDGRRSPLIDCDVPALRRVQRGTMHHSWKDIPCLKNPFDLAIYGRLLWEQKTRTVIEIGYKFGGSALWFADQGAALGLDLRVCGVDVTAREMIEDPRITFLQGDGRALGETLTPEVLADLPHPWVIVEDADHHYDTTLAVLEFFAPHMQEGDYMTVEDGCCDTFGNMDSNGGGPNKAIFDYTAAHPGIYEVDEQYCDYFGNNVTWCTNGYLRRSGRALA